MEWEGKVCSSTFAPSSKAVLPDDDGCSAIEMMDCSALALHEYLGNFCTLLRVELYHGQGRVSFPLIPGSGLERQLRVKVVLYFAKYLWK